MTEERFSPSRGRAKSKNAIPQLSASLEKTLTTGQLIFNIVLIVLGLLTAAIMFSIGISWSNHESTFAGIGLILAGLFLFWRGGNRLSWLCAEIKTRRQKKADIDQGQGRLP